MTFQFKNSFNEGINLDADELRMPPNMASFIKNLTDGVNPNPTSGVGAGGNMKVRMPIEGNQQLGSITLPAGDNYCKGFYSSEQTNEGYFFLQNSNSNDTVWVIDGENGSVTKVFQGNFWNGDTDPASAVSEGRCTVEVKSYMDQLDGNETNFKFLIFTFGGNMQYFISVDDSIATNSFTTAYFSGAGTFYERNTLYHLGVPTPLDCISITPVTPAPEDDQIANQLTRKFVQFRVKFIDVYGRPSEHGKISRGYLMPFGGCTSSSAGISRCVDLTFDAGNPLVDYVQIEYREWVGNDPSGAIPSEWMLYETITKWVHAPGQRWYQRSANTTYYNAATNKITYRFCGDKLGTPLPPNETSRTQPGLPRRSNSIFPVNKVIGVANNVRGFQPIDPDQVAKISYSAEAPAEAPCAPVPMRTIIMYANIYRPWNDGPGATVEETTGIIRKSNDKVVWGNEDGACDGATSNSFRVDQVFGDQENPGFIFYLAGTPYACVAQWGNYNRVDNIFIPNPDFEDTVVNASTTAMCQIKLQVPAGKYVLRGASHKAKITDSDYQSTSTYIAGITTLNAAYASLDRRNYASNPTKEWVVDCTSGDVIYGDDLSPIFVILDMSGTATSPIDGYLYEQEDTNVPIEMNPILFREYNGGAGGNGVCFGSFFTDHNGFFFGSYSNPGEAPGDGTILQIAVSICGPGFEPFGTIINTDRRIKHAYGGGSGSECAGAGNWMNRVYIANPGVIYPYPEAARRKVTQSVLRCDTEIGISGTSMVMTKGAVGITDSEGVATMVAHNRYDYSFVPWPLVPPLDLPFLSDLLPDYASAPESGDILVFTRYGACVLFECGGCSYDLPSPQIDYAPCGTIPNRDTEMPDYYVKVSPLSISGIQSGGRYSVGFWAFDEIGRHTAFQIAEGEASFVNAPLLNSTDSPFPAFVLSELKYSIEADFQLPSTFKKIAFGVTRNLRFSDFITWRADYIQFIDNTGKTNTVNPSHIRIYYGSINEYSKLYGTSVNCVWDFLTSSGDSTVGDMVEFIANGVPGTSSVPYFLPQNLTAPISFDKNGLFFLVEFKEEFRGLVNGALFRIIRPKLTANNYQYYETCLTIDLVDGMVPEDKLEGTIPYRDSYMLSRLIPVPNLQGQPGALPPGAVPVNPIEYTSTNLNTSLQNDGYATSNIYNNGVYIMSVNDSITATPFFFESPSPSDFWGSHVRDEGRVGFVDKYEAEQRIGTEVAISNQINERSVITGISYFDDVNNAWQFDRNTWGNIVSVIVETSVCLFICERDHFTVEYNSTQLQLTAQGVTAKNQYGPFTTPNRKAGTNYGCDPRDINSIRRYAGIVRWLDRSGYIVLHNFNVADSNTDNAGYLGYILNKIGFINNRNLSPFAPHTYVVGAIDPKTYEYYLTWYQQPGILDPDYINNESQPVLSANETLCFDLATTRLKSFASFTPEYYGLMPSFFSQRQFISFKQGKPYIHHANFAIQGSPPTSPLYCNFYGTQCEVRITHVINAVDGQPLPDKVKRFLYTEMYVRQSIPGSPGTMPSALFFADVIQSEKGQVSRLLIGRWDLRDGYQCAAYLCATNTPADPNLPKQTGVNAILDGDPLQGRWLKVSLINNPEWGGTYFELSEKVDYMNALEKSAG